VDFGTDITTTLVTYLGPTQLRADIAIASNAAYAKHSVTVTNGDGRTVVGDTLFEVTPTPPLPGHLYLVDQQPGVFALYKIRASDTTVVRTWTTTTVSSGSPQGLAFDGTNLWLCASGTDKRIYKLDTTGTLTGISSFAAPSTAGTLRGIVMNAGSMWLAVSGTGTARIYRLNPTSGAVIDSVTPPGIEPRGITFVNGFLYCNDTSLDSVYVYNPLNAKWTGAFATPTPSGGTTSNRFATGLAWDGSNFWIANSTNNFDHVYRMSPTGLVLQSFAAPGIGSAQLTGLVYTPN
jgi:streptogramin lyase